MFNVRILSPDQWEKISEKMHEAFFGNYRPTGFDRVDFVLTLFKNDEPAAFVSCREIDKDTLYWAHGGSYKNFRGTSLVSKGLKLFLKTVTDMGYRQIQTRVEHKNTNMLRMHLKHGFLVKGCMAFKDKLNLELVNDLKEVV